MALYYNSETLGTLIIPKINYKWLNDGWSGVSGLIRSDVPFGSGSVIDTGILLNAPVGTFVPLFEGATGYLDGQIRQINLGIIRTTGIPGDDSVEASYAMGASYEGVEPSALSQRYPIKLTDRFGTTTAKVAVGYTQYDDQAENPCNAIFLTSPFETYHAYQWFEGAVIAGWNCEPVDSDAPADWYTASPISCTYTDDQLGITTGFDLASVQDFNVSRVPSTHIIQSGYDIITANGGGDAEIPSDFQGTATISLYLGGGGLQDGFYTDSYNGADAFNWMDEILYCGLIDVYNPTGAQIRGIAQQLRDPSFIANISKMWDNPIESIISLAVFPVGPTDNMVTTSNIYLGGLDTKISARKLIPTSGSMGKHSVTVNLGTISINEENKGFLDYDPANRMMIYLPYIGFRTISASMVMNCRVTLKYEVDFLSGDCTAIITTIDNNLGYSRVIEVGRGNVATQVPLTSTNYIGMYSGLLNAGAAVVSGNLMGAVNSVLGSGNSMQHAGSLGGNAGNISPRRAFILSDRPPTKNFVNFNATKGRTNYTGGKVGSYEGFTIGDIIIDVDYISDTGKRAIAAAFREGVIV